MFKSATLKLTAMYVGILVVICLLFSSLLYQVLSHELDRNNDRQTNFFEKRPRFQPYAADPEATRFLNNQLAEGKERIFFELLYIDLILLVTGGIASYFLARKTLEPIEEAHEAQTRFTADASHELRTPLATMQTEIEVALRDPKLTLKESKELLTSNLEEISTLRQLTSGLLSLARSGQEEVQAKPVSVRESLDTALARTEKLAKLKHTKVIVSTPKQLKVRAQQQHLTEVFVTVLDNAIKYSHKDMPVTVTAKKSGGEVLVVITDEGIGIAPANLAHVFERFYRADNARSQSGQNGHGLGLSIAKQLVGQYGGSITITSVEGKGTSVTIQLPKA